MHSISLILPNYFFRVSPTRGQKGFFYRYNHVLSAGYIFPKFGLPKVCETRVCHASELPLVFHRTVISELNITLTELENQISNGIVDYWTSFAKTGTPTGSVQWPLFDIDSRRNILLGNTTTVEDTAVLCALWDGVGYNH